MLSGFNGLLLRCQLDEEEEEWRLCAPENYSVCTAQIWSCFALIQMIAHIPISLAHAHVEKE